MIILRDYQLRVREALFGFLFGQLGNPLACLPTGTGKSLCIADTCYAADYYIPGSRVVIATHSKELVEGNAEELRKYWPAANIGIYSASLKKADDPSKHQFMYCGIDSVYKKGALFGRVDILIIDEAHLVDSAEGTRYALFIAALQAVNPLLRVVGFSATAWRSKTGSLAAAGIFTHVCYDGCTLNAYNWFEDQGYLAKLIGRATDTVIDLSEVHTRGGDYDLDELETATAKVTREALIESADLGFNRNHWLVYGSTIAHVEQMTAMLNTMGIPAAAVHSKQKEDRKPKLEALKAGKLRALVSQGVLTTGVNLPCVDMIVGLRATKASSLHVQIMGRGTRPVFAPGYDLTTRDGRLSAQAAGPKNNGCLVADYARNIERLGPINDPWIPDGKKKGGGGGGGEAPVRCCDICKLYTHASKSHCDHCGAEFPVKQKIFSDASNAAPVVTSEPEYKVFDITNITFHVHKSTKGRGRSLRVSYHAGLATTVTEYVHVEAAAGSAVHARALEWLRERGMVIDFPIVKIEQVMESVRNFRIVSRIRVIINRKYPEIVGWEFNDGTKSRLEGTAIQPLKFG